MLKKVNLYHWPSIFLVAFILSAMVSTIFSVDRGVSQIEFLYYLVGVIIFFISYKTVQNEKYRRYNEWFLYLIIAYTVVIAAGLLYQHSFLHITRPRSYVGGVNIAARYLELTIPVMMSLLLFKGLGFKQKIILGISLVILLSGLYVTQTRGAWLAIGIITISLFIINKAYKFIPMMLAILPILALVNNSVLKRMQINHHNNIERLNGWSSSLHIIQDYPWTGIGFGNFKIIYKQYMMPNAHELLTHAHNIILIFATEGGLLTLFFFILFVVSAIFYVHIGVKKKLDYYSHLAIGMVLAMLAVVINGLVDHPFNQPAVWILLMFEIGFSLGLVKSMINLGR